MKKIAATLLVLTVTLAAATAVRAAATLDIYWIDVEGGASTLIVTPAKESILVDTGWAASSTNSEQARSAARIHDVAVAAGLSRIDYLITTHFHIDHFGGAADLAKLMPIGEVADNGIPDHDPDGAANSSNFLANIKPYRDFHADHRQVLKPGQVFPVKQTDGAALLTFYCVGARKTFPVPSFTPLNPLSSEATQHREDTSDNANSIVLLLKFGPFRFFDGGDLTWNMEGKLVSPQNVVGTVDVYQADHHGMNLSNNPLLVRSLGPTVAVIDNGPSKGGHPETLATLRAASTIQTVFQLHRNILGGTNFNTDFKYIANLPEHCEGNYIKCSVDPSGKSYTISIPAKGFSQTYATRVNAP